MNGQSNEGAGVTAHEMRLHPAPFAMIKSGQKRIELRLMDEKRRRVRVGDLIRFCSTGTPAESLIARVSAIYPFSSFEELYRSLPLEDCGYRPEEVASASPADMASYYSEEEEKRFGVVGIRIEPLNAMEEQLCRYFAAWLAQDAQVVRESFAEDAVYSECYGPEYRGLAQILRWFEDWNRAGRVLRWDIKRILRHENTVVAEWHFVCDRAGTVSAFDGVTIADFDREGKRIVKLSEFQSKAEHSFPYGDALVAGAEA